MKWLLGLLVLLITDVYNYCTGQDACPHMELELEMGSATIVSTQSDGRQWKVVVKCKRCHEKWSLAARTRHAF
jgi:hypothetical protein